MRHTCLLPNVISYKCTISACEKVWQCQHALSLFAKTIDFLPNAATYRSAISACVKGLLVDMKHIVLLPVVISYMYAFSACAKGWQWQHAPGLLVAM